ncbi:MAG: hypothetical protein GY758_33690, partial [Fuerstiella sp.]|nr:hypothetical protein [Fuerstiella sp.]
MNTPISHMVGQALGYGQPQTQPQPSAVDQPQQYEMYDEDIMDYLNEEPQQKLGIPVELVGQQASAVNQPQPGGLQYQPQATPQGASLSLPQGRDRLMDRLSEAKQQEAEAAHRLMLSRHHGNPEYNIARGRGTPEEEVAFQGQLAGYRNRDANREFAMTPGGEQMNRFAQLQAMQSNVNQPQGDDTQANLQAMREKGYGDIIMRTRDGRLALTSRGNKARGVRHRETGDVGGQVKHNGQMISAATPGEYMDQAAAN